MSIPINSVYFAVNTLVFKFQSRNLSPDEFNSIASLVNMDYLKIKVGLPETYKAGFPVPPQAWQITQPITDELFQLHEKVNISKGTNGYFAIPVDYAAFSGCWLHYTENVPNSPPIYQKRFIEIVPETVLRMRLWNSIIPPTLEKPIAGYYSNGLEIYPLQINLIEFSYLRYPKTPLWNFTLVNDEEIFNPVGSQDFEYPNIVFGDIVARMLSYYGISLRANEVIQYSEQRKAAGT